MLLVNVCTPARLVNRATGEAVGVIVDPEGTTTPTNMCGFFSYNSFTISGLSRA
jgi:hypothetical protein